MTLSYSPSPLLITPAPGGKGGLVQNKPIPLRFIATRATSAPPSDEIDDKGIDIFPIA